MIGLALALALGPVPEAPPTRWLVEVLAAPPAGDRWRFPPPAEVHRWSWFGWKFRQNLLTRAENEDPDRRPVFRAAVEDCWLGYRTWELLWNCDQKAPEWQKRLWLAELRTLIGEDDYYAGVLPEAVPGWLFHDLSR